MYRTALLFCAGEMADRGAEHIYTQAGVAHPQAKPAAAGALGLNPTSSYGKAPMRHGAPQAKPPAAGAFAWAGFNQAPRQRPHVCTDMLTLVRQGMHRMRNLLGCSVDNVTVTSLLAAMRTLLSALV